MATKKAARARTRRRDPFPGRLYGVASPRSIGGVSMFEPTVIDAASVARLESDADVVQEAETRLRAAGFDVLQATSVMINIAGSRTTFEKAFATNLVAQELSTVKERGRVEDATFFDDPSTDLRGLIS